MGDYQEHATLHASSANINFNEVQPTDQCVRGINGRAWHADVASVSATQLYPLHRYDSLQHQRACDGQTPGYCQYCAIHMHRAVKMF